MVADGEDIALGLDPSKSDDHTALIGVRIDDGYQFTLGVWVPKPGQEIDRADVDLNVRAALEKYRVLAFLSDLHPFESYVDAWARDAPHLIVKAGPAHKVAFDMRTRTKDATHAHERLHDLVVTKAIRHDGDRRTATHFHNARRRPNAFGVIVGKEHRESPKKIDSVPSAALAHEGRRLVLASGKRPRKRSGKATFA
ncbi:MAG: hypothetical protein PGN13_00665 [Patulibacter minatonensis]